MSVKKESEAGQNKRGTRVKQTPMDKNKTLHADVLRGERKQKKGALHFSSLTWASSTKEVALKITKR